MPRLELLVIGLVIGSNNLAAALALGALGQAPRRPRVAVVFGIFEFAVPLLGLWIGRTVAHWVEAHAGWIGAVLLVALGAWAVVAGTGHRRKDERLARLATSWRGLALLAAGLSIDNLVIGFSLGLGQASPFLVAATIAVFSVAFTWVGMGMGGASRRHWERSAEVGTGLLLIGLGVASALGWL